MKCPDCKEDKAVVENVVFEDIWFVGCPCGYESDNRVSKQEAIEQYEFELSQTKEKPNEN